MRHPLIKNPRVGEQAGDAQRGDAMKKLMISVFVVFLAGAVLAMSPVWGQHKNLSVNPEVTAKIRAFDGEFFKGFDIYSAGTDENPSALLFDIKDDFHLPDRFWGKPLNEEEIIYAIHRLDDQYISRQWDIPFEPRALYIVNRRGEILGYCYTGMTRVLMDRRKDGQVTVFLSSPEFYQGGGSKDYVVPTP
jgi:hypothetical protein